MLHCAHQLTWSGCSLAQDKKHTVRFFLGFYGGNICLRWLETKLMRVVRMNQNQKLWAGKPKQEVKWSYKASQSWLGGGAAESGDKSVGSLSSSLFIYKQSHDPMLMSKYLSQQLWVKDLRMSYATRSSSSVALQQQLYSLCNKVNRP